jgi:PST family polysaccharide transporter
MLLAVLTLTLFPALSQLTGLSAPMLAGFAVVGTLNSFYPTWLFQGLERMHNMIVPTALSKLCAVLMVFMLVRSPADAWAVPFSYGVAAVLLNITAWVLIRPQIGPLALFTGHGLIRLVREAGEVFWSRLIIMIYVACSPMLIRSVAGASGVAIYSLCEKAVGLGRVPFDMLANAAYPRLAREYRKASAQRLLQVLMGCALITVLLITATLLAARDWLRPDWARASTYMAIYVIALVPMAAHSFLGTCVLLVHGKRMQLSLSVLVGLTAYVVTFGIGGWWFHDQIARVITAMVMVEFGICASRFFHSRRFELI